MLRWGILGAAKFAQNFMGPAIHAADGNQLVALASRSDDKVAAFQSFCPALHVHNHYEALLAADEIDAVYIPLPNHLHVAWALKALAVGKHVLCEKPIAMQDADFDKLIAARDETGLLLAEAFMIVHHPQWQYVRDLIASGEIGELRHISGRFSFDNRADPQNIRNRPETGGGALRDIGVYVLGAARFVTGCEPAQIAARITWENEVDVFTDISAQFGAATYSAYVSTRMAPSQEMVFHGTKGLIRLPTPFNARVFGEAVVELHQTAHVGGGRVSAQRFPMADHYKLQVESFARAVQGAEAYPVPLEFSRGTQAAIDRIFAVAEAL